MIRFELKKIFKSKLNLIAMALGVVLILVIFISQHFGSDSIYCEETDSYLYRKEALLYSRDKAKAQGDVLSEEMIESYLKKVQDYEGDLNSDEAYTDFIRKDGALFYYLYYSYEAMQPKYDFNSLKKIDLSKGAGFYNRRLEKISDYLNMDFSFGNYSEAEKNFWMDKAQKVTTPFPWASKVTAERYFENVSVGFYFIVIITICISPMFSKENDTGAAQLLLTTKYGKTKLVEAKIIASLIFSVGYIFACTLFAFLLEASMEGFYGLDLPVQLLGNAIPYNMKMWQICLLTLFLIIVMAICTVSIMLLTSACTKSSIGTMSFTVLFLFVPAFIPYSKESRVFNHILDLTFIRTVNLKEAMQRFSDFAFGPIILDQITMCIIVWLIIAVVCLIPVRSKWGRMR